MKQIPINCKEVLQALLDKTKTKDIRKAYEECPNCCGTKDIAKYVQNGEFHNFTHYEDCPTCKRKGFIDKPCKYEVGDVCEIIWTGDEAGELMARVCNGDSLGKVKIKSVEKIRIKRYFYSERNMFFYDILVGDYCYPMYKEYVKELSKTEGFKSPKEMFKWLEEYAPEIKERAMPFWLIEWEYVE